MHEGGRETVRDFFFVFCLERGEKTVKEAELTSESSSQYESPLRQV